MRVWMPLWVIAALLVGGLTGGAIVWRTMEPDEAPVPRPPHLPWEIAEQGLTPGTRSQ
jgi:hypothetical protein